MFRQLLTPVGDSLGLSFLVAILPIVVVLVLLGVLRRPAWQAALAALVVGLIIAVAVWQMPVGLALNSVPAGAVFALWPVMWIVFNALLLYNIAVQSGRFDAFRAWMIDHLPNDRRVVLVVVGFCFGALLEGIAGFGTPVAITSSLLILVGFPAARGAGLRADLQYRAGGLRRPGHSGHGARRGDRSAGDRAGAMVGRQLPFIALILPFYVIALYGGWRSVRALWPVLLVAGASFAGTQFLASNFIDYTLTDVLSSLLAGRHAAVRAGLAARRPIRTSRSRRRRSRQEAGRASRRLAGLAALAHRLRGRDRVDASSAGRRSASRASSGRGCTMRSRSRSITTSPMPRSGPSSRSPRAPRSWWPASSPRPCCRAPPGEFFACVAETFSQVWLAIITVVLIVGLAYLMNYSGLAYTLGQGACLHRLPVRPAVALPRLDRGGAVRQRHLRQRAVRQSAGGRGAPAATSIRCCSPRPIPPAASWAR